MLVTWILFVVVILGFLHISVCFCYFCSVLVAFDDDLGETRAGRARVVVQM